MDAKDYIERLTEISVKKLAILEEILSFTRNQNEYIKAGRLEALDLPAEERHARSGVADNLDEQFAVYAARLKSIINIDTFEKLPQLHVPGTKELKNLVVKIDVRRSEIKRLEEENIALLRNRPIQTEGINGSNALKRMSGAYSSAKNKTSSTLFDKKK